MALIDEPYNRVASICEGILHANTVQRASAYWSCRRRYGCFPYCDEYGGAILNATIGHYAYASIEPLEQRVVQFTSCDQNQSGEYESTPQLEPDGSLDLLKFVHNHVVRE